MTGRKQNTQAVSDYIGRLKKAKEKIPADRMKRIQEKTKDNNQKKFRSDVNGYYMENVATPAEYAAWEDKVYRRK